MLSKNAVSIHQKQGQNVYKEHYFSARSDNMADLSCKTGNHAYIVIMICEWISYTSFYHALYKEIRRFWYEY